MFKSLVALTLFLTTSVFAGFTVPALPNPVNDYANVLTVSGKEIIATEILKVRAETKAQLGVLIVDTLNGEAIETASMKVAETWKLGRAEADDGVLLLVAIKDRKMRIEVGSGVEGILTDYQSNRIINAMKPLLKVGKYDDAILLAVTSISEAMVKGKDEVVTATPTKLNNPVPFVLGGVGLIGLFLFFVFRKKEESENSKETSYISIDANEETRRRLAAIVASNQAYISSPEYLARRTQTYDERKKQYEETNHKNRPSSSTYVAPVYIDNSSSSSYSDSSSSSSSYSSSDDSSSSSTSSSSDWSGGGGDFSGGGSSGDW